MRLNRFLFVLLLTIFCFQAADAQKGRVRRAGKLQEQGRYQEAIDLYLRILDRNQDAEAIMGIADAYYELRDTDEMEYWYGLAVRLPIAPPETKLRFAEALMSNKKYSEAEKWINEYLQLVPDDTRARLMLKSTNEEVVKDLKTAGALYQILFLKELNTNDDEFSPAYYKNGIVFVSDRSKGGAAKFIDPKTGGSFTDMYFVPAQVKDSELLIYAYGEPEKLSGKLSYKYHDGPASFLEKDGGEEGAAAGIFFTRNNMDGKADDGLVRTKIYFAKSEGDGWGEIEELPFNSDVYSVKHPAVHPDGSMLFFASDMPGGFGGFDLYVSYMENGRWGPPLNLGPTINTEGHEAFPFIHQDGILYFASKGHVGLGGYDIYQTKEVFGAWDDPVNLGYPVNSSSDDYGVILNERKTHGYFSSSREYESPEGEEVQSGRDNIYSFTKFSVEVELLVFDKATSMPLEDALIYAPCGTKEQYTTDADGRVTIEMPVDKACDFSAELTPYKPNSVRISSKGYSAGAVIREQIPLEMERVLKLTGTVVDGLTNNGLEGAEVTVESRCGDDPNPYQEGIVVTDEEGVFNFELNEDCDYRLSVYKPGYSEGVVEFSTAQIEGGDIIRKSIAIDCLDGPCDEPDSVPCAFPPCDASGNPILGPRRLLHVFFDFDRADIRPDARPALDTLLSFMRDYPTAKVEVSAHTDARGGKAYNKRLSRRRAKSVVAYLMRAGVSRKRLRWKAMGEEVMLNDCYDGVECSEAQHQENRRVEFMVFELEVDGQEIEVKSLKPNNIVVDPCTNCGSSAEMEEPETPEELPPGDSEFDQ